MNIEQAIEALGIKGKTELARKLGVTVQSLYKYKEDDLPSKLVNIVNLLVKINKLESLLADSMYIIDSKNEVIKALKEALKK